MFGEFLPFNVFLLLSNSVLVSSIELNYSQNGRRGGERLSPMFPPEDDFLTWHFLKSYTYAV